MRRCAKVQCEDPARAVVVLRYGERVLWLRDLAGERDPNFMELCRRHADRMTAPVGWTRLDDRVPEPLVASAAPVTRAPGPARRPRGTPMGGAEETVAMAAPVAAAGTA